jgi:hypothetical protein
MSRTWTIIIAVVAALILVIYVGGCFSVGDQPIFAHIDSVIGVPIFMGVYNTIFSMFDQSVESELDREEDPFTKMYQDNERIVRDASE